MDERILSFTDLRAWQEGHVLVLTLYKETKDFPKEEMFGLTSQIRRACVSITSNIAEGFSRGSYQDKLRFYIIALGSLTEVQNQLLVAKDVSYISVETFKKIAVKTVEVSKILNGLIKKTREFVSLNS